MKAMIGTYFDSLEAAQACVEFRNKNWKHKFRTLVTKKGFIVISESALKNHGLLPRRRIGETVDN